MSHEGFTSQHRAICRAAACWSLFFLLVVYAVSTVLGLLFLKSPQNPIGDPFFTIMELLIILIAPLMVVCLFAVHAYASAEVKVYSLTAFIFMILLAGISSSARLIRPHQTPLRC